MSIDGIGGPKGPSGPIGSGEIAPMEPLSNSKNGSQRFSIGELANTQAPEPVAGDPTIESAFESVATEIRCGRISSVEAGFEVLIERLVEGRFGDMPTGQRQRFVSQLKEILLDDQVMGRQIQDMLRQTLADSSEGAR